MHSSGETVVVEEYIEEPEDEENELQAYQAIDPDPPYEEAPDETWSQLGIVAGAVLVLAGVLFFVRKKFSKGQLPTPIQEVGFPFLHKSDANPDAAIANSHHICISPDQLKSEKIRSILTVMIMSHLLRH